MTIRQQRSRIRARAAVAAAAAAAAVVVTARERRGEKRRGVGSNVPNETRRDETRSGPREERGRERGVREGNGREKSERLAVRKEQWCPAGARPP